MLVSLFYPLKKSREVANVHAAIDIDPLCYSIGSYTNEHPFVKDAEGKPVLMPVSSDEIAGLVNDCIQTILTGSKCDSYTLYLSSSVSTNFRTSIAKTYPYKGRRTDSVRPYHHQTVVDYLLTLPETKVADNREADDDVADAALADPTGTVICTIDKDLDGSHDHKHENKCDLTYYNWKRDEYYTLDHNTRFKFFCKQLLTGDWTTDSILGCGKLVQKVYGPKAAKAGQTYERRVGVGPKQADNILDGLMVDQYLPAVAEAYKQEFGTEAITKMNEMAQLLFMGGSEDNLWEYKING